MAFTDRLANRGSISTEAYEIEYSVLLVGANCEGEISHRDILSIRGPAAVQEYLVN